jgi:hypothetical protein
LKIGVIHPIHEITTFSHSVAFMRAYRRFVRGNTLGRQMSGPFVFSCFGKMLVVFIHETKPPHCVGLLLEPVLFFVSLDFCFGILGERIEHGGHRLKHLSQNLVR